MIKTFITLIFVALTLLLVSCINWSYEVEAFDSKDLKWFKSFNETDTIIFESSNTEYDTIIFKNTITNSDSIRSYSQGYYNTNYLTVAYEFTRGSYHQFAKTSDNKTRYRQRILSLSKTSNGSTFFELVFIGVIFDKNSLKNIKEINDGTFLFQSKNGTYSKVNVEKGIKSFVFEIGTGITTYIDERKITWTRK